MILDHDGSARARILYATRRAHAAARFGGVGLIPPVDGFHGIARRLLVRNALGEGVGRDNAHSGRRCAAWIEQEGSVVAGRDGQK